MILLTLHAMCGMNEETGNIKETINKEEKDTNELKIAQQIFDVSHDQELLEKLFATLKNDGVTDDTIKNALALDVGDLDKRPTLYWAVYRFIDGNVEIIKLLLEHGATCNELPMVMWALEEHRDKELAALLINAQQGVNAPNNKGVTPLEWAVENDDVELAKLLFKNGALPDKLGRNNITPLRIAILSEDLGMIKVLLKHGANANNTDADGLTPLILVAARGNVKIAQLLIENGANINKGIGNFSRPPLYYALENKKTEMIKFLCDNKAEATFEILIKLREIEEKNSEKTPDDEITDLD